MLSLESTTGKAIQGGSEGAGAGELLASAPFSCSHGDAAQGKPVTQLSLISNFLSFLTQSHHWLFKTGTPQASQATFPLLISPEVSLPSAYPGLMPYAANYKKPYPLSSVLPGSWAYQSTDTMC